MFPYYPRVSFPFPGLHSYGSLNLTETSPPQSFDEPLKLAEVKQYLQLPEAASDQDGLLSAFISAAREQAEILQGRDLVQKQWDLSLDYLPSCPLELRAPLISVDLFRYRNSDGDYTTLATPASYIVDTAKQPAVLMPPYGVSWPSFTPWPSSPFLVRFTSGYTATSAFWNDSGQRIRMGMHLLISAWFNGRLPFDVARAIQEFPYAVTACLSAGALVRVR